MNLKFFLSTAADMCIKKIIKLKMYHFSWDKLDTVNPILSAPLILFHACLSVCVCVWQAVVGGGGGLA